MPTIPFAVDNAAKVLRGGACDALLLMTGSALPSTGRAGRPDRGKDRLQGDGL